MARSGRLARRRRLRRLGLATLPVLMAGGIAGLVAWAPILGTAPAVDPLVDETLQPVSVDLSRPAGPDPSGWGDVVVARGDAVRLPPGAMAARDGGAAARTTQADIAALAAGRRGRPPEPVVLHRPLAAPPPALRLSAGTAAGRRPGAPSRSNARATRRISASETPEPVKT
ncbi:MAG: hypothetical protein ACU0CO_14455, partial [Shimia sp.]